MAFDFFEWHVMLVAVFGSLTVDWYLFALENGESWLSKEYRSNLSDHKIFRIR